MTLGRIAFAGLRRHARTQIAVALGVMVATAALVGALLVGDSLRGSLREMALRRLGRIEYAVTAVRSISAERVAPIAAVVSDGDESVPFAAVLTTRGSVTSAAAQTRANGIAVWGVNTDFWPALGEAAPPPLEPRTAAINEPLARQLGLKTGDEVLLQVPRTQSISPETLLGRRDDPIPSVRLRVAAILPDSGAGAIALAPSQQTPLNLFLPLSELQRLTDEPGRINTILISTPPRSQPPADASLSRTWLDAIGHQLTAEDLRLTLRVDEARGYFALESATMLLDPDVEAAAMALCSRLHLVPSGVISYLANSIRIAGKPGRSTPYSIVTGVDPTTSSGQAIFATGDARPLQMGEILLNQWTADDLEARPGDTVEVTYYVTGEFGELSTDTARFRLREILPMNAAVIDPGFVPPYKGVTDVDNLADWDPPFPMELDAIRPKDEAYWDEFRTAPKAFVLLEEARRRWAEKDPRFGQLSAIRFTSTDSAPLAETARRFESALIGALPLESLGVRVDAVREHALAAGAGTTDFGGLFIGFSFFLIAAAAILIALLFRLNVERRATEVGTLRAIGWRARRIACLFLTEGAAVCAAGVMIGLPASCAYAWLMLAGLQSWWSAAVNAPLLSVHVSAQSLAIGGAASWLTGMVAIAFSLRGLKRVSPRALLAGQTQPEHSSIATRGRSWRSWLLIAIVAIAAVALGSAGALKRLDSVVAFFLSGVLALVAMALVARTLVTQDVRTVVHRPGFGALARLAWRNARRNTGRSTATIVLIAMASFLILALSAFRLEPPAAGTIRTGGTGGFTLYAESTTPILRDPNDWSDVPGTASRPSRPAIYPLRLQPGDAGSCLNLYIRRTPRILGATEAFIDRGGFSFAAVDARYAEDRENPWRLLEGRRVDGEIPAIGDEAAVRWQFHKDLGDTLEIEDERGRRRTLRFVALLSGSVLQDELIICERAFKELYPSRSGYSFFLIDPTANPEELLPPWSIPPPGAGDDPQDPGDVVTSQPSGTPPTDADALSNVLEQRFAEYGLDVRATRDRLADYLAVQNTYLSTFQTLGGFGLLLGGLGLAAIMLRNVWERRGELALLRAVGYRTSTLGWIVILESAQVLLLGMAAGVLPALVAVAPLALSRPAVLPLSAIFTVLILVPAAAILAGALALRTALRAPIADTLKRDD